MILNCISKNILTEKTVYIILLKRVNKKALCHVRSITGNSNDKKSDPIKNELPKMTQLIPKENINIDKLRKDVAIENFGSQKNKKNLAILGIVGITASLSSMLLGSVTYGLSITPLLLFHYDALKKHIVGGSKNFIFLQRYLVAKAKITSLKLQDKSLGECFHKTAIQNSHKTMIHFANTKWTYRDVELLSNKVSNYFSSINYKKGDVVAIMMTNRPEYISLILGFANIGIVSTLLDISLKNEALLYALYFSNCRALIVSEDLISRVTEIKNQLNFHLDLFQLDGTKIYDGFYHLESELQEASFKTPEIVNKVHSRDLLLSIFTTPDDCLCRNKKMSHSKFLEGSLGVVHLLDLNENKDILYNSLPLCHATTIVTGLGPALLCGIPVVLSNKFSPSKYWRECTKYKCTVGQYSNETCEKLLNQPQKMFDKSKYLKKIIGDNVNSEIWKKFINQFIKDDASSNNVISKKYNCINIKNNSPTLGFITSFNVEDSHVTVEDDIQQRNIHPPRINTNQLSKPNFEKSIESTVPEFSLLQLKLHFPRRTGISPIGNTAGRNFKEFIKPDMVHIEKSVNMHLMGNNVHVYQCEGKMVMTKEVEAIFNIILGHPNCLVYGVTVPGVDKKFGMITIVDNENEINMQKLSKQILKYVPRFACPVIIRIILHPVDTVKFGMRKLLYSIEGFDPSLLTDKLFYFNKKSGYFEPLTKHIYTKILNNKISF